MCARDAFRLCTLFYLSSAVLQIQFSPSANITTDTSSLLSFSAVPVPSQEYFCPSPPTISLDSADKVAWDVGPEPFVNVESKSLKGGLYNWKFKAQDCQSIVTRSLATTVVISTSSSGASLSASKIVNVFSGDRLVLQLQGPRWKDLTFGFVDPESNYTVPLLRSTDPSAVVTVPYFPPPKRYSIKFFAVESSGSSQSGIVFSSDIEVNSDANLTVTAASEVNNVSPDIPISPVADRLIALGQAAMITKASKNTAPPLVESLGLRLQNIFSATQSFVIDIRVVVSSMYLFSVVPGLTSACIAQISGFLREYFREYRSAGLSVHRKVDFMLVYRTYSNLFASAPFSDLTYVRRSFSMANSVVLNTLYTSLNNYTDPVDCGYTIFQSIRTTTSHKSSVTKYFPGNGRISISTLSCLQVSFDITVLEHSVTALPLAGVLSKVFSVIVSTVSGEEVVDIPGFVTTSVSYFTSKDDSAALAEIGVTGWRSASGTVTQTFAFIDKPSERFNYPVLATVYPSKDTPGLDIALATILGTLWIIATSVIAYIYYIAHFSVQKIPTRDRLNNLDEAFYHENTNMRSGT